MTVPLRYGYTLGRVLGEGGMGRVFEATRVPDGLPVALKMLRSAARDLASRRSLVNEALAAAALSHPNLVEVLDLGDHPRLGTFLVSELVEGSSLEETRARDLVAHVRALEQVCEGLSAAHAAGVVHGDLKPSNVLVTAGGVAKVCDFGVAQVLGPSRGGAGRRIRAGTPYYMAPEQFEPEADLDPRSDLYAVGIMLFEALVGHPPFRSTTLTDVLREKLDPARLPARDREGRPISPDARELHESLVRPELRARPRFAEEVRGRLAAMREVLARTPPPHPLTPSVRIVTRSGESTEAIVGAPTAAVELVAAKRPAGPTLAMTTLRVGAPRDEPAASAPRSMASDATSDDELPLFVPARHAPGAAFVHVRPPPLVGREDEIAELRAAMRQVIDEGASRLVLLVGEGGTGKSRIAAWGLAESERTGSMEGAMARYTHEGLSPTRGLRGVVARLLCPARRASLDGVRQTARHLRARGLRVGFDEEALGGWLAVPSESDLLDARTAAELGRGAIASMAKLRPVYLWLDDLVWARDGAIDLVRALLEVDAPVLVVATVNAAALAHPPHRSAVEGLLAHPGARRVDVDRLGPERSAALLRAVAPLDRDLAARVVAKVDTRPLVLMQLLARWIDAGQLELVEGQLVAPRGVDALLAGTRPEAVLGERIDALVAGDPAWPGLFAALSLLGAQFTGKAWRGLASALGLEPSLVDLALDEALLRGILRVDGGDQYRFEHGLLQAELGARLAQHPERRGLAVAAAQALFAGYGRERPDVRVRAATLLREGERHEEALETVLWAADDMGRGGDLMLGQSHVALARKWALEDALPDDHPLADLATYVEARAHYFALDYARALPLAIAARERAEARGDAHRRLEAICLEHRILFYSDRIAECGAALGPFLREVQEGAASLLFARLRARHLAAHLAALRGDLSTALAWTERTVAIARVEAEWALATFEFEALQLLALVGRMEEARARLAAMRTRELDVYQLVLAREVDWELALLSGERRERRGYVERVESAELRADRWRRVAGLVVLAAYDVTFGLGVATESVPRALDAFELVAHDEGVSHWALGRIAERGAAPHAARAARLLEARHALGRQAGVLPAVG